MVKYAYMKKEDINAIARLYMESVTRSSEKEIEYYMDEIFGNSYSDFKITPKTRESFSPPLDPKGHPKYDHIHFDFLYNGTIPVKVISGPGIGAKEENGSLSVSIFYTESGVRQKDTNAFYNNVIKDVNYDPIITNGKDLLMYVKSVLDRDDRETDEDLDIVPSSPSVKPNKKYAGV
jgi:hypothetical protein